MHPRVSLPKGLSVSLMLGDEVILPKSHFFFTRCLHHADFMQAERSGV